VIDFLPKVKLEILVIDERAAAIAKMDDRGRCTYRTDRGW
jgi:hypothetical protein